MKASVVLGVLSIAFGVHIMGAQSLFGPVILISAQEVELWTFPLVALACWLSPKLAARLHGRKLERKPWNVVALLAIMVLAELVIFQPIGNAIDDGIRNEMDWVKLLSSEHAFAIFAAIATSAVVAGVSLILEGRRLAAVSPSIASLPTQSSTE